MEAVIYITPKELVKFSPSVSTAKELLKSNLLIEEALDAAIGAGHFDQNGFRPDDAYHTWKDNKINLVIESWKKL